MAAQSAQSAVGYVFRPVEYGNTESDPPCYACKGTDFDVNCFEGKTEKTGQTAIRIHEACLALFCKLSLLLNSNEDFIQGIQQSMEVGADEADQADEADPEVLMQKLQMQKLQMQKLQEKYTFHDATRAVFETNGNAKESIAKIMRFGCHGKNEEFEAWISSCKEEEEFPFRTLEDYETHLHSAGERFKREHQERLRLEQEQEQKEERLRLDQERLAAQQENSA